MGAGYSVWICNDRGVRIKPIDVQLASFEYLRVVGDVGWFGLTYSGDIDPELVQVDNQIHFYRRPRAKDKMALDFVGFMRKWVWRYQGDVETVAITGFDPNELIKRRIVAFAAGTSQASASNIAADDAMKDVWAENYMTGTGRDLSGAGVTVQNDATAGQVIDKGFAWRDIDRVLGDMAEASRTAGTEVFWKIAKSVNEETGVISFEFQTTAGIPGRDLTWDAQGNGVIFGPKFGNVIEALLEQDYNDERNAIYAGGQGEELKRIIKTATNDKRIGASTWNRRELFVDARNESDPDAVQDVANAKLAEMRPRTRFEATLQDSQQARYGVDWDLGDKVTVRAFGKQFDGIIRSVHVKMSPDSQEVIDVKVLSEDD